MAAENASKLIKKLLGKVSFNEAAAHGRGKRSGARSMRPSLCSASMRPRRMAAENPSDHDAPTAADTLQ